MHANTAIALTLTGALLGILGCEGSDSEHVNQGELALRKSPLSTPTLSIVGSTETTIDVRVCAGTTGAPAGISLQWMTADAYAVDGWQSDDADYCAASFSGAPRNSIFSLEPGECTTVTIGDLDPTVVGLSFEDGCND